MTITSETHQVRLLISDVGGQDGTSFIFTDSEIDTFLAVRPGVLRASALALRTIASNEVQVSKRITFLDLSTDGPAVANALRLLADTYDKTADQTEEDDADFDIATMGVNEFSRRYLRGIEI